MMNTTQEPNGCLAAILGLFGIRFKAPTREKNLPYRLRDDFLSPAEFSFYRVLFAAIGNHAVICPKVNLSDLFYVVDAKENQAYRNKIDRKHIDFLVCDPTTMKPRLCIELDDASHGRRDRQERDAFVEAVFAAAALPLLRLPAQRSYNLHDLQSMIIPILSSSAVMPQPPLAPTPSTSNVPICPKCGIPMALRTATKGSQAGQQFFGCQNYPKCREVINS